MNGTIEKILEKHGIELYGAVPFSECVPANMRLYEQLKDKIKTAIVFAVPYRTELVPEDKYKMSSYARVYDYHRKFDPLFEELINELSQSFNDNFFAGYADHSPVNEKHAALIAGMGSAGRNSLLITDKYGSFVFLGSVFTDLECADKTVPVKKCIDCGRCVAACPAGAIREQGIDPEKCLSGINQKRSVTDEEAAFIAKSGYVWGCDECQNVCPLNEKALKTDDAYFTGGFIKKLSQEWLRGLSDEEFAKYPFSWRKREVILRNIALIDGFNLDKTDGA